jgi:transcriptional regulator with XRE-family HTH domain
MPIRTLKLSPRQLRLRDARKTHGVSLDELARVTGIERTRIWRGECGYIELPEVEVAALEAVFGTTEPETK